MSVQVKRRRESAAFLAGYVGAQGELLIDTTNNRVQVHDGTTPGGWPAATIGDLLGRNVVINGTFAINQRAYASGATMAAGIYAHDCWKAGANGCTYSFTQAVPDTMISITAGTLIQALDVSNVYATTWWLTWAGTATARVWQGSASGSFSAGTPASVAGVTVNVLLVTGLTAGAATSIEFAAGTVGLVQLDAAMPNVGPKRFERRQIASELLLCRRYFQRIGATAPYKRFGLGVGTGSAATMMLFMAGGMRALASFSYGGQFALYDGATVFAATSMSIDTGDSDNIDINVSASGLTARQAYQLVGNNDITAHLDFSAEL